jgi:hypothetical protein
MRLFATALPKVPITLESRGTRGMSWALQTAKFPRLAFREVTDIASDVAAFGQQGMRTLSVCRLELAQRILPFIARTRLPAQKQ